MNLIFFQENSFKVDLNTIDWKVILAAGALVVALIALIYFQWWRNRKRMSYEIISNELLISSEEAIRDEIEITYRGTPVKNVRLVVIKLINDGYLPIKKDEFDNYVRITFPNGTVLSAEKLKFYPDNIDTSISYADDWVEIDPALFNRGDYIILKALVSTFNDELNITTRIVGISKITLALRKGAIRRIITAWLQVFVVGFILISYLLQSYSGIVSIWLLFPMSLIAILTIAGALYLTFFRR